MPKDSLISELPKAKFVPVLLKELISRLPLYKVSVEFSGPLCLITGLTNAVVYKFIIVPFPLL